VLLPIVGALVGLCIGSFIAALTIRWPAGRSLGGRSHCETCARSLPWFELVPIVSYLALRGRCRGCGAPIGVRQLAIEAAGGIIGAVPLVMLGSPGIAVAGLGWALLLLFILDAEHFWLPDRVTLPLAAAGLVFGAPPLPDRLIGLIAGFLSLAVIAWVYRRRTGRDGMGGGDAKLLAAIGAWLGWQPLPWVVLAAALLGLLIVTVNRLRGHAPSATTRLPLGALLAPAAWLAAMMV
jgi:leader peptidase (prepilin peptidase)/N-methyltransferase